MYFPKQTKTKHKNNKNAQITRRISGLKISLIRKRIKLILSNDDVIQHCNFQ